MIVNCPHPECEVQVQRTQHGTLQDGLAAHFAVVHPGDPVPTVHPSILKESS